MMSFIIRLTSAWNSNFSAESLNCFISATLSPSSLMASSSLCVCVREGGRESVCVCVCVSERERGERVQV